jgi:hypothetical protein
MPTTSRCMISWLEANQTRARRRLPSGTITEPQSRLAETVSAQSLCA